MKIQFYYFNNRMEGYAKSLSEKQAMLKPSAFDLQRIAKEMSKTNSETAFIAQKQVDSYYPPEQVRKIISSYKKVDETEFRFGLRSADGKRFVPGISSNTARILNIVLEDLDKQTISDTVKIYRQNKDVVREIVSESGVSRWEKKSRVEFHDDEIWGIRTASSKEIPVKFEAKGEPEKIRKRHRTVYLTHDSDSAYYAFQVEVTRIDSHIELEVEINKKRFSTKYPNPLDCVPDLRFVFENIFIAISESEQYILQAVERERVISEINKIFPSENSHFDSGNISNFTNKPSNITDRDFILKPTKWFITEKTDGTRGLLYINNYGVYLVQAPRSIKKISDAIPMASFLSPSPCLLEVEVTIEESEDENSPPMRKLSVFDILQYAGNPVWKKDFSRYFDLFKPVSDEVKTTPFALISDLVHRNSLRERTPFTLEAKMFYTPESEITSPYLKTEKFQKIFSRLKKKSMDERFDGIIFQDPGSYVIGDQPLKNRTFKWKPIEKLTIDFLIQKTKEENVYTLHYGKGDEKFKGSPDHPTKASTITISPEDAGVDGPGDLDGKIIEAKWVDGHFEFLRIREDKTHANGEKTVMSVWKDINEPFDPSQKSKDFRFMRIFHNEVKRNLLAAHLRPGDDLVDSGSGQGGDISKWTFLKLRKVLAIEPDPEEKGASHLPELKKRILAAKRKTDITVGEYGLEDTEKILKTLESKNILPKVISAFFCLTFFHPSNDNYEKMLDTLEKVIPEDGHFIGTVLDGEKLRAIIGKETKESEDLYMKIKGNRLNVRLGGTMVDYVEYLFDFDRFVEDMEKRGFLLQERQYLDENYNPEAYEKLSENEQFFSRLNISFVFQKKKSSLQNMIAGLGIGETAVFNEGDTEKKYYYTNLYQPSERKPFLNAVLYAIDPDYRALFEKKSKSKIIEKFNKKVFSGILPKAKKNPSLFLKTQYAEACIAEYIYKKYSDKEARDQALKDFVNSFSDLEMVLTHHSLLEFMMNLLDVNIVVLNNRGESYAGYEIPVYDESKSYIMLCVPGTDSPAEADSDIYYPIYDEEENFIFDFDEEIVQKTMKSPLYE